MRTIYLTFLCLLVAFATQAKHTERHIRYNDKISDYFFVIEVKHTDNYTALSCVFDEKYSHLNNRNRNRWGSTTKERRTFEIDEKLYLEDYHLGTKHELIHTKGIKFGELLRGRKRFKLFFPPLEGELRDANLCTGDGVVLMSGISIDRRADLKYRPEPTEYGSVTYCDLQGTFVRNPKTASGKVKTEQRELAIQTVEMFDEEIVFTLSYNENSSLRSDVNFWQLLRFFCDEGIEDLIDESLNNISHYEYYKASSYQIGLDTYLENNDTKQRVQLKKITGIDYDKILLLNEGKAGEFKLVFPFDGDTKSKYNLVMKSGRSHYLTLRQIELEQ